MPLEFLTDEQAAAYGCFTGPPSRLELERYFFLDDADRALIARHRGDHSRLGFGLQLVTVRFLGTFLTDPLAVPVEVLEYVAEQLGVADSSCVKRYVERDKTRLEHVWEIQGVYGFRDFAGAREELSAWVHARSWTTGEGPKAIFDGAVVWLRERSVLLPGVWVLARLVTSLRQEATQQLWETLYGLLNAEQRSELDGLLEVPPGARTSQFDQLRKPPTRVSGPGMVKALDRVSSIVALGVGTLDRLPVSLHPPPHQRPRPLLLRTARPQRRPPRPARSRHTRRGRGLTPALGIGRAVCGRSRNGPRLWVAGQSLVGRGGRASGPAGRPRPVPAGRCR